ncbi:hypothetical protein BKA70DRAFT_1150536 [Coprinopsis sp. MPI-PUGE-AT-0042]|nr:hypothetical protein BKA70DRAFT_1150536 [Coprinopsis sp. MPI-PUGE-AT-0042]
MTLHNQTKPGPKEGPYNRPAAGPAASRVPTHSHPIPAEWGRVLLRKELLKKIMAYLDLDSMFSLGRTCRSLNDIVFASYINNTQPDNGYYGHQGGYLMASTDHPEGLLTAFRCSITLHTSLTSIAYGFLPNRGLQGLMQDLSDLHTLIQRQPRAMQYVSLYFSQIDHGLKTAPSNGTALRHLTTEAFRDKLCSVVDSAIQKGAKLLDVNGGYDALQMLLDRGLTLQPGQSTEVPKVHLGPKNPQTLIMPYFCSDNVIRPIVSSTAAHNVENGPPTNGQRTSSPTRRSFFSRISKHLRPSRTKGSAGTEASISSEVVEEIDNPLVVGPSMQPPPFSGFTFNAPPSVEELRIRTDMLLSPLFLSWTLDVIENNARTLQNLKFECSETLSSTWHKIFESVTLPRLQKLHIIVAPLLIQKQLDIDPDDIIRFLSRCEAVEDVIFYGVRPAIPSPRVLQRLHVPQLASFAGHPSDVLWMLKLHKSLVPKLRRIVITTEYYGCSLKVRFEHTLINDVLDVLDADGRELVLGFDFRVKAGLEKWMLDRVQLALEDRRSLPQIRRLDISFSWYMNFTLEKLQVVSKFINTFPSVEYVAFNKLKVLSNHGTGDATATKAFFSKHLLKVKMVKVNREAEVPLDRNTARTAAQPGPREQLPGPPIT